MYDDDGPPRDDREDRPGDGARTPAVASGEGPLEQAGAIARYKKMYERSSALARIGVWECDLATEALTWTDGVYDLFELPRGSPIDRGTALALYDESSRLEMERLRDRTIRDGGSFTLDIRVRTAKGNPRWIRLTGDVEREDGRSVRIFGTKQDITAEKSAQERVRALQAELIHVSRRSAMGAMAATLAHELNQPLAAIGNFAAGSRMALEHPEPDREVLRSGLEAIANIAARAGTIIRTLREMNDGSAVRRQTLDPNPVIAEAAALALPAAEDRVAPRFALAEGLRVSIDPIQMQQVMIVLIKNAYEAMLGQARRELVVSSLEVGGQVEIRVEDSGDGIDPALMDRLFDAAISDKPDGMGAGLSISRTIVEAHGGRLSASNRANGGAAFCVALPVAAEASAEPA